MLLDSMALECLRIGKFAAAGTAEEFVARRGHELRLLLGFEIHSSKGALGGILWGSYLEVVLILSLFDFE